MLNFSAISEPLTGGQSRFAKTSATLLNTGPGTPITNKTGYFSVFLYGSKNLSNKSSIFLNSCEYNFSVTSYSTFSFLFWIRLWLLWVF